MCDVAVLRPLADVVVLCVALLVCCLQADVAVCVMWLCCDLCVDCWFVVYRLMWLCV